MDHDQRDASSDVSKDDGRADMTDLCDEQQADQACSAAGQWWIRRVQRDAEVVESLLRSLERAERGPLSLGKLTREYRKLADGRDGLEPLSRDRLYGALVLLALVSIAETAAVLGRSDGAVKQLQLRGVRNLAKLMPDGIRG